jgi:hypothetical protein
MLSFDIIFSEDSERFGKFLPDQTKKHIRAELDHFIGNQKRFGVNKFRELAPLGETGLLKKKGVGWHPRNPRKNANERAGFIQAEVFMQPINDPKVRESERDYPFFVHGGTLGPILSKKGGVMSIRDKNTGKRLRSVGHVRGQKANPFFMGDRNWSVKRLLSTNFGGIEKRNLEARIAYIIEHGERKAGWKYNRISLSGSKQYMKPAPDLG